MVSFCTKKKPGIVVQGTPKRFDQLRVWFFIHILPKLNTELEMEIVFYKTNTQVSVELKRLVWDTLLEKFNFKRPGFSEDYNLYISSDKSVNVEIYQSIIIWHLATDLCFYTDHDKEIFTKKKVIKEIADYMMYIIVFCPILLSSARDAKITFEKSCEYLKSGILVTLHRIINIPCF